MTTLQSLEAARAKIADPKRWTTQYCARDAFGVSVDPKSSVAVSWCAFGAIPEEDTGEAVVALKRSSRELYGIRVTQVNDGYGHEAVMKMYDHAIANQKESVTA